MNTTTPIILNDLSIKREFSDAVRAFLNSGYIFDGEANDFSNMTSHCVLHGGKPEIKDEFILVELDNHTSGSSWERNADPSYRAFGIYRWKGFKHWNQCPRRNPTEVVDERKFYILGAEHSSKPNAWTVDLEFAKKCRTKQFSRYDAGRYPARIDIDLSNKKFADAIVAVVRKKVDKCKSVQCKNLKRAYWIHTGWDNDGILQLRVDIERNGKKFYPEINVTNKCDIRWGKISPKDVASVAAYLTKTYGKPVTKEDAIKTIARNLGIIPRFS